MSSVYTTEMILNYCAPCHDIEINKINECFDHYFILFGTVPTKISWPHYHWISSIQNYLCEYIIQNNVAYNWGNGLNKVDQTFSFSKFGFSISILNPKFGNLSFNTPETWIRTRVLKSWVWETWKKSVSNTKRPFSGLL